MCPYVLELGPITIASFGLMVAFGFLSALFFLKKELERKGIDPELGSSLITTAMIGGLVGSKLYFVIFETPPGMTWGDTFGAIFSGAGLTWYGGFVVAAAAIVWMIKRSGAPVLQVADAAGICLAIGYAVGRIGCQLAGDGDYGIPTDLPWAMAYPDGVVPTFEKVHPTPVYETLSHLGIFGLLWATRLRLQTPGLSFCLYLVLAGTARFLVEFIRINQKVLWGLSDAQLLSVVMIVVGLVWGGRLLKQEVAESA
ncbi:MAG: prolipoprotein diacylglyceryl transferase [Gemmatimonadetes bacterium]|jgi:phosphatidylglycerol---prolipoprotein diacylglyceryl transferase|nr:prolipoprotein diacylglyceryl transferase [Gemmatimonadota bacterium]